MTGSAVIYEAGFVVVRESWQKSCGSMAVTTVRVSVRVGTGWGVNKAGCLAYSDSTIMASFACSDNVAVIEATIGCQFQKAGGIVAAVAFGICR